MSVTVAFAAPGSMGAGVAKVLMQHGAAVRTVLAGRSTASARRAEEAGIEVVDSDDELVEGADFLLAILPAGEAVAFAERIAPAISRAKRKPVYADCNAISPETARRAGEIVEAAGCVFVDAGVFGAPPATGDGPCPKLYVCGPGAQAFTRLVEFGMPVEVLDGPVGTASTLKILNSGITKGVKAVGIAVFLAASEHGIEETLLRQISVGLPEMSRFFERFMPGVWSRAYRSVAEMEELAAFVGPGTPSGEIYTAAAHMYEVLDRDIVESGPISTRLSKLF